MKALRGIEAADLFCGAGGTSQGMLMAANRLRRKLSLVAVNHWQVAIDTHALNHAEARNLCTGLAEVQPHKLIPGGKLDLLCASPECTHHSVARGGKPMDDQSRSSAWLILQWAQQLYIKAMIFENVPEWESWGPLGANGKPLKSKRGELFRSFVATLRALGYRVEWRVLNCADYGAPTTRRRLFMICRRDGKAIVWPEPTHVAPPKAHDPIPMFADARPKWRTAREIIDWTLPSRSIFGRKKPLAENTLKRIEAGLLKFNGIKVDLLRCVRDDLRPYLMVPPGATLAEAQAFLLPHRVKDGVYSMDEPMRTVTATSSDFAMAEPFVVPQFGSNGPREIDRPLGTVTTTSRGVGLAQPFTMQIDHASGAGRVLAVDAPVATLVTKENTGLAQPFLAVLRGTSSTATVDKPLATVTGSMGEGVAQPWLIPFYGTSTASGVDRPVPTVTCKDRFGLMGPDLVEMEFDGLAALGWTVYLLDIHFRMLQPRELARAQGFPDSYRFTGNREEIVKQIGNAVPPHVAEALCYQVLSDMGTTQARRKVAA